MFLDEGIMFKVSPNPGLNLTRLQTTGPRPKLDLLCTTIWEIMGELNSVVS